ncbi:DUF2752 domain-containing protein [Micromonospora sp. DT47]|uniref:DUF2752 domain-containing protein n=1 Tax=Micromonospora sp. DT47 TaxID=3393431 RepID=UPI003CF203EA
MREDRRDRREVTAGLAFQRPEPGPQITNPDARAPIGRGWAFRHGGKVDLALASAAPPKIRQVDVRRYFSVPERLGVFGLAVGVAAAAWPATVSATGLALPCPLRWLTGVPCPACGLTTASVAMVRGDFADSVVANPAILALAALAVVVGPLLGLRAIGALPPPVPWSQRARWRVGWGVALFALESWAFQLNRLGIG